MDDFGGEEDTEETPGAALVADFLEIVAGSAIVNNGCQAQNPIPGPWGICSQEGRLTTVPGAGMGNNGGLEILMAEVGQIFRAK